jgi:hypothetical protein
LARSRSRPRLSCVDYLVDQAVGIIVGIAGFGLSSSRASAQYPQPRASGGLFPFRLRPSILSSIWTIETRTDTSAFANDGFDRARVLKKVRYLDPHEFENLEESIHVHSLMREGLIGSGLRCALLSFAKSSGDGKSKGSLACSNE